jgi:hypothetical protein
MPDVPGIPKSLKSVMAKYYARVMAAGATDPEIAASGRPGSLRPGRAAAH